MNEKLLITIDTEPDCDSHWNRSNPLTFSSITEGIPKILRPLWQKYNVNPIYFVSPEVLKNEEACNNLRKEIDFGAIIGTHLHSEYVKPNITIEDPAGRPSKEYPCYAHSSEIEFQKIKNLTKIIQKKLRIKPKWYRAARYGADINTIMSLKELGYKYDSSITPKINWEKQGGPNHIKAPEQPYWVSKNNYYMQSKSGKGIGIKEFPITISGKRFGFLGKFLPDDWYLYEWLRPTHMTLFEEKKLVDKFIEKYKNPTMVMMFHSMEVMPGKSPFVRNKFEQKLFLRRLEKTIEYCRMRL